MSAKKKKNSQGFVRPISELKTFTEKLIRHQNFFRKLIFPLHVGL